MYYVQEVTSYSYSNVPHMTCNDTHTDTYTDTRTLKLTLESQQIRYTTNELRFFGDAK